MRTFYYIKPTARVRLVVTNDAKGIQIAMMFVVFLASNGYKKVTRAEWREWKKGG